MRRPRSLAPDGFHHATYHCVSRVVDRAKVLGKPEKEQFIGYMQLYEILYEKLFRLHVLTFCLMDCLMDNHFHFLVVVPKRPEILPPTDELMEIQDVIRAGSPSRPINA